MSRRRRNAYRIVDDLIFVDVSTKKHPSTETVIDLADLALVIDGGGRWYARSADGRTIYATRCNSIDGKEVAVQIHRHLCGLGPGHDPVVDHRDRDGLNNRRKNLRIASHEGNRANGRGCGARKRFKGVFRRVNRTGEISYRAAIQAGGEQRWLGTFKTETEAAAAYNQAARASFGEFAWINQM